MPINFGQPTESQTVAARNTSSRDAQVALAKWLEGEAVTGPVAGIKRLNGGLVEEWNGSAWVEKALAYAKLASPTFTGTPAAPTAAVDTNTTQLATTAYVVGQAGGSNPTMNGTVAPGTSLRYARQDHVHPVDTTRAPLASPNFSGTPTIGGAAIATQAFVTSQGYVAGGSSPSFGSVFANNWFRSTADCGWYSETYGGGVYMADTTFVRTWNSKHLLATNARLYAYDGGGFGLGRLRIQAGGSPPAGAMGDICVIY